MTKTITKEMALTWAELRRAVPSIAAGSPYAIGEASIRISAYEGQIIIAFESKPERKLGNLRIPVASVGLCFNGISEPDKKSFLHRFERVLQRGGG